MAHSRQAADSEWKLLQRLGEQLVQQSTPQDQCRLIVETAGQLLSASIRVWLASPSYPLPGTHEPDLEILPDAEATLLVQRALASKKIESDHTAANGALDPSTKPTAVATPLTIKGTMLGVMLAERADRAGFTERDLSLMEAISTHAAAAMEITRQEKIKDWRLEQLSLVRSVSAQISSLPNIDLICEQVTQLILRKFHYYYVAIFTLEESQGVLRFRGSASQNQSAPIPQGFVVQPGDGIIGTIGQSGAEIVALDVQTESRYRFMDVLPETRSEAALPLKIENRILGVLDVQSDQVNAFHESDMLVLRAMADNIAMAIESKRLYTSLERRADQISSVFEVGHALTSILDLDELLDEVVHLIQDRFGYPFVHVYTVHPGRRLVIYQAGSGERSAKMKEEGWHYPLDAPKGLIPWVARNGRTFLSNDVTLEPLYLTPELPPSEIRSELTLPILLGGEVLGVLDIQSLSPNAFDENDRTLFEALAAPIAVAMRNATLYRSEMWRRKVAESFRDVAQIISNHQPLNQLLDLILERLEALLPCDVLAIWLVQEDRLQGSPPRGSQLRLAASRNINLDKMFEVLQDKTVQEMLDRAMQTDQPIIRQPDDPLGPLGAAMDFPANYSSIAAPMRNNERPLGLITLAHHQNGRYGSESQAITATFASYAAVAIQNSRLYNESQEQALISTMLLQVAEASQTTMTIEDLLATMIRLSRLLMGVKKCTFLLWEESLQSFVIRAWYGFEPGRDANGEVNRRFTLQTPALARLAQDRSLLYLDDVEVEMNFPEMSLYPSQGTIIMLPLLVRREVIGAFLVGLQMASLTNTETGFDPKALAILQGIAHQTAMTVDNLSLLEARQEEAYVTAALLQVAQAVVSSTDLNDTLDTIVHLLPILVGIETCMIYLWDSANLLFRPTQVSGQSRREEDFIITHPFSPGENRLLDAIHQTGEMHMCRVTDPNMLIEDWAFLVCQPYSQLQDQVDMLRGDWILGYPLSLQGQVMGIMVVREVNASPAFWERRLEIINGIAQQASLAIQNDLLKQEMVETERMEREIQLARQIQETFLPDTLPQLNRWELDLRWETAREIGGDFYDIFKLGDNRVGLVIADVADKGLPAALYMTVARTLIRASATDSASPAKVLEEVNRLLVNDSTDSMFITVVYIVLSLDSGEFVFCNAGHNRPLLYRAKNRVLEQLVKGGTALGILEDLTLTDHTLRIDPGDALILYTDGVTDIISPEGEMFGEERLREIIQTHGRERIQDMLENLDDAMIDFRRGTPPVDDVTLLAIRRDPAQRKRVRKPKATLPEVSEAER